MTILITTLFLTNIFTLTVLAGVYWRKRVWKRRANTIDEWLKLSTKAGLNMLLRAWMAEPKHLGDAKPSEWADIIE